MSDKPTEAQRLETAIINLRRESSAKKHQLLRLAKDATSKKGIGDMAKRLSAAENDNTDLARECASFHEKHLNDQMIISSLEFEIKLLIAFVVVLIVLSCAIIIL